jgi:hypothetical protein
MMQVSAVLAGVVSDLSRRNPNRAGTLHHINLRLVELDARKQFHQDPTPDNLTAWCDAHEALEAAK